MNTKTVLIFLGALAVLLGIFSFFAVFGSPTGSYSISGMTSGTGTLGAFASSSFAFATSTATSSLPGIGSISGNGGPTGPFASTYATPPLSWPQGQSTVSITGIALQGNEMTFTLSVQTGAAPECVPLGLRLVADEEGDLNPPDPTSFSFPDSGNCNGAPNQTYANQTTTFMVDPTQLPLLFTTGGASNIFFEIATTSANGLNVVFPGTSG